MGVSKTWKANTSDLKISDSKMLYPRRDLYFTHFPSYPGDLVTYMGDWETPSVKQETPRTDHQEKTRELDRWILNFW